MGRDCYPVGQENSRKISSGCVWQSWVEQVWFVRQKWSRQTQKSSLKSRIAKTIRVAGECCGQASEVLGWRTLQHPASTFLLGKKSKVPFEHKPSLTSRCLCWLPSNWSWPMTNLEHDHYKTAVLYFYFLLMFSGIKQTKINVLIGEICRCW